MGTKSFTTHKNILADAILGNVDNAPRGLGAYFGVPTPNVFSDRLKLLSEKASDQPYSKPSPIDELIDNLIEAGRGMAINDIIKKIENLQNDDDPARKATTAADVSAQINITYDYDSPGDMKDVGGINRYGSKPVGSGQGAPPDRKDIDEGVASIKEIIAENTKDIGINKSPKSPSEESPALAVIQIYDVKKTIRGRGAGIAQIFFNAIPTVEMSRCVPYFNLSMVGGNSTLSSENKLVGMNLVKSLVGEKVISKDEVTWDIITARDVQALRMFGLTPEAVLEIMKNFDATNQNFAMGTVGMEMFTTPQTLVPVDADGQMSTFDDGHIIDLSSGIDSADQLGGSRRTVSVLDPFKPVASIDSFTVDIEGQFGFQAFKKAVMNVTVHDRSRLHEIAPLIRPDYYGAGRVKVLIEYGWSHPDGNPGGGNIMGQFLDSMKTQEVFIVTNVSMNFGTDGQVKLTVNLHTSGAPLLDTLNISTSESISRDYEVITALIETINLAKKEIGGERSSPKALNKGFALKSLRSTSGALTIDKKLEDEARKYIKSINNLKDATKSEKAVAQSGGELFGAKAGEGALAKFREETVADAVANKIKQLTGSPDPFLSGDDSLDVANTKGWIDPAVNPKKVGTPDYISLGKVLTTFVGQPLAAAGQFAEVQFLFYTFNPKAGFVRNLNMAQFPINVINFKKALISQLKKFGNDMSLTTFIMFIRKYFVSSQGALAYGLSEMYTMKADGYKINGWWAKHETKLRNRIATRMKAAYGGGIENDEGSPETLDFKLPKMTWVVESIPMASKDAEESQLMLRIHVYDSCASAYETPQSILRSTFDSHTGLVGVTSSKARSAAGKDPGHTKEYTDTIRFADSAKLIKKVGEAFKNPATASDEDIIQAKYVVVGSFQAIKNFIALGIPTIKYGTNASVISNLSITSQDDPLLANISFNRSFRTSEASPPGAATGDIPMQVAPLQLTLDCLGNPFLEFGQEYFVDLQTGTSADNIYLCSKISHSISPGEFKSNMSMTNMDRFATYRSLEQNVEDVLQALAEMNKG